MSDFPPVIILAGGLGTRISELYPDLPKALIPLNGEPFIKHQLRLLLRQGVDEAIICVGHLHKQLEDFVGSGENFGLKVRYSYDGDTLLGTGGAVFKAAQMLSGPFAVLYGDSYLDTEYAPIKKAFIESNKLGLMTVFKNNNQWDKSNILCDAGLVTSYNKKQPSSDMQYIDYGLSVFSKDAFKNVRENNAFDLSDIVLDLIKKKELAAYEIKTRFYEMGSPKGIEQLRDYLSK